MNGPILCLPCKPAAKVRCIQVVCAAERYLLAAQVADFHTVVFRQKQLGFNAVRLPMTFSDLNLAPKMWTKPCIDDTASLKVPMHASQTSQTAVWCNKRGCPLSEIFEGMQGSICFARSAYLAPLRGTPQSAEHLR